MLERCKQYTDKEIHALRTQPRLQQLLRGVIHGANDEAVVRSFTVLYEDFLPLRLGGDLIFRLLDARVQSAGGAAADVGEQEEEEHLARLRVLFSEMDVDGSGQLSRDEIVGSGFNTLLQAYGVRDAELFLREADADNSGELSFEEFVRAVRTLGVLPDAEALLELVIRNRSHKGAVHSQRFDAMLQTFSEWQEAGVEEQLAQVPSERLQTVIAGCFAGARNPGIVTALRILYVDYAPLRMGGNLIFDVAKRAVGHLRAAAPAAPRSGVAHAAASNSP